MSGRVGIRSSGLVRGDLVGGVGLEVLRVMSDPCSRSWWT